MPYSKTLIAGDTYSLTQEILDYIQANRPEDRTEKTGKDIDCVAGRAEVGAVIVNANLDLGLCVDVDEFPWKAIAYPRIMGGIGFGGFGATAGVYHEKTEAVDVSHSLDYTDRFYRYIPDDKAVLGARVYQLPGYSGEMNSTNVTRTGGDVGLYMALPKRSSLTGELTPPMSQSLDFGGLAGNFLPVVESAIYGLFVD